MKRFQDILSFALKISACSALICLALFALELRKSAEQLTQTEKETAAAVSEVRDTTAELRARLTEKGGLIDISKATMLHIDRAAGEAAIASRQQRAYWDQIGQRTVATLDQVHDTVKTLDSTIAGIGKDVHGTSDSVNAVLGETQTTVASLNKIVADPEIPAAVKSLAESSQNVDKTTVSIASIANTMDAKVKQLAHPSKAQRAFDYVINGLRASSYLAWLFK